MIRRLHLRGWRSFKEQTLEVGPGLIFVLAENGVGKTSLIEAAAWGLYGPLSGVDAVAARRIGARETSIEVELELPDGRVLDVRRAVGADGETDVVTAVGGDAFDAGTLNVVLAQAFGASADFLSRTTAVPSSAVADETASAFALHEHLCRVLGVDGLLTTADQMRQLHDQHEAEAKEYRTASRRAAVDLADLAERRNGLEERLSAVIQQRFALRSELDQLEDELRQARRNVEARERAAAAHAAFEAALARARPILASGPPVLTVRSVDDLVRALEEAERSALLAVDQHRKALAFVAGRFESVTSAVAELGGARGDCPVCRRPLSDEDVEHAQRSHVLDLSELESNRAGTQVELGRASQLLDVVRGALREALAISSPAEPPSDEDADVDTALLRVETVRARYDEVSEQVAVARATLGALEERTAAERAATTEREVSLLVHRKAALSHLAAEVARQTADQLLAERIDPLAAEVRSRWKHVFGDRGALQLGADGRLTLRQGVDDIPFEYLSSGEKVVALLAVRLLVLGSSTRSSFLWLDEPLEHLDPRNRRLAASLMSAAGVQVRQVLVTTYEEDLARRLARLGQASLLRIR